MLAPVARGGAIPQRYIRYNTQQLHPRTILLTLTRTSAPYVPGTRYTLTCNTEDNTPHTLRRASKLIFSTTGRVQLPSDAPVVWKDLEETFPKLPFSLGMPTLSRRACAQNSSQRAFTSRYTYRVHTTSTTMGCIALRSGYPGVCPAETAGVPLRHPPPASPPV